MILGNPITYKKTTSTVPIGYIDRQISGIIENDSATKIRDYAFCECNLLQGAIFPNVSIIGSHAFESIYGYFNIAEFPMAEIVGTSAFKDTYLKSASFPKVKIISDCAFCGAYKISTVYFPEAISIYYMAFNNCEVIQEVYFPKVSAIGANAFGICTSLMTASFPKATVIKGAAFFNCTRFISLYLNGSSICSLLDTSQFYNTPIGGYSTVAGRYGSIYVPASLYNTYISASGWSQFASRFVSI